MKRIVFIATFLLVFVSVLSGHDEPRKVRDDHHHFIRKSADVCYRILE